MAQLFCYTKPVCCKTHYEDQNPMTEQPPTVSFEQFLKAINNDWTEVVNGEMCGVNVYDNRFQHAVVVSKLYSTLHQHIQEQGTGHVFPMGLTFVLDSDQNGIRTARIPDLSYLRVMPGDIEFEEFYRAAPTLAVEVVSPADSADILQTRIDDYLRNGTEQVWAIYPRRYALHRHLAESHRYSEVFTDTFSPDDLFPGLTLDLQALVQLHP